MKNIQVYIEKKGDDREDTINLVTVLEKIESEFDNLPNGKYQIEITKPRITSRQNRALHVFFQIIADALNEAGLYMTSEVFKQDVEIEWTPDLTKEYIWRPVQKALTGKKSTTQLKTNEVNQIAEIIQRNFSTKGIILHFPSIETLIEGTLNYEVV